MRVASSSSSVLSPETAHAGGHAPGVAASGHGDGEPTPPRGLSIGVVLIGLLFLGPFAYVGWRNVDLGLSLIHI